MPVIEEQLIELQTRLAFQEDTISRLNAVLTSQQQQIDCLRVALDNVVSLLGDDGGTAARGGDTEEPPPHY